jgi:hypothetical protein
MESRSLMGRVEIKKRSPKSSELESSVLESGVSSMERDVCIIVGLEELDQVSNMCTGLYEYLSLRFIAWVCFEYELRTHLLKGEGKLEKEQLVSSIEIPEHLAVGSNELSKFMEYVEMFWDMTCSKNAGIEIRNTQKYGLGVFEKSKGWIAVALDTHEWVEPNLKPDLQCKFRRFDFNSFIDYCPKYRGLLYGPLALVNHCCSTLRSFKIPKAKNGESIVKLVAHGVRTIQ